MNKPTDTETWARLPERKHSHYNVRPRYTCGSPASVTRATAEMVAQEEAIAYSRVIDGYDGEAAKARAESLGLGPQPVDGLLRSPAEYVEEHKTHWLVQCLITGKLYVRPFQWAKSTGHCKRCNDAREYVNAYAQGYQDEYEFDSVHGRGKNV